MAPTLVYAMSTDRTSPPRVFTHAEPVWRSLADFIIFANVDGDKEQLWAKQLSENTFRICCIPFFVYNISLGDVVETDANYCFTRVIEHSGRFVFRAWMLSESRTFGSLFVKRLEEFGALVEVSSKRLVAIDAMTDQMARDISAWLAELEQSQHIQYETGQL